MFELFLGRESDCSAAATLPLSTRASHNALCFLRFCAGLGSLDAFWGCDVRSLYALRLSRLFGLTAYIAAGNVSNVTGAVLRIRRGAGFTV